MYSSVAHTVCLGVGVGGVARGPAEFFGNSFNFDSTWYDAGLPCHCFLVAQVVHSLHLLLLPSFFFFFFRSFFPFLSIFTMFTFHHAWDFYPVMFPPLTSHSMVLR